jgi:Coenzyme PQQ synthesis protein D (PqqD)
MLELSDRVIVPPYVLIRHLGGESVLLNLESEIYFGLDAVGTRMWEVATQSPNLEAAHARLVDEFEVDPGELKENLTELLTGLVQNGLLQRSSGDVGSSPAL